MHSVSRLRHVNSLGQAIMSREEGPAQNLLEKRATSQYLRGLTFIDSQVVHPATDARLSLINVDGSFFIGGSRSITVVGAVVYSKIGRITAISKRDRRYATVDSSF